MVTSPFCHLAEFPVAWSSGRTVKLKAESKRLELTAPPTPTLEDTNSQHQSPHCHVPTFWLLLGLWTGRQYSEASLLSDHVAKLFRLLLRRGVQPSYPLGFQLNILHALKCFAGRRGMFANSREASKHSRIYVSSPVTNCDEHIHIVTAKPSQKAAASLLQELAGPGVTEQAS